MKVFVSGSAVASARVKRYAARAPASLLIAAVKNRPLQRDRPADFLRNPGGYLYRVERRMPLKAHIESDETPAFALDVARSGLKVKPVGADDCDLLPGRSGAPLVNGYPAAVLTPPRKFADGASSIPAATQEMCSKPTHRSKPAATSKPR